MEEFQDLSDLFDVNFQEFAVEVVPSQSESTSSSAFQVSILLGMEAND